MYKLYSFYVVFPEKCLGRFNFFVESLNVLSYLVYLSYHNFLNEHYLSVNKLVIDYDFIFINLTLPILNNLFLIIVETLNKTYFSFLIVFQTLTDKPKSCKQVPIYLYFLLIGTFINLLFRRKRFWLDLV